MKAKMTEKEAKEYLYNLWENGLIPSNFTEDHEFYSIAIQQLMLNGNVDWEDLL